MTDSASFAECRSILNKKLLVFNDEIEMYNRKGFNTNLSRAKASLNEMAKAVKELKKQITQHRRESRGV